MLHAVRSRDKIKLPKSYTNLNKVPLTTRADSGEQYVHYTTHANKRAFPLFALNKNPIKINYLTQKIM